MTTAPLAGPDRTLDAVVLDLGGVVCTYDFAHAYTHWGHATGVAPTEVRARVTRDLTAARRFERGQITVGDFHAHVNTALGTSLDARQLHEGWNAIFTGLVPGITQVIEAIASRTRLVCLSNTNALHASFWRETYAEALAPFERIFVSHEIGARKPDAAAYRAVLEYLNLPPSRVAFFDDQPPFVEGGRAVGLRSFRVEDAASIESALGLTRGA